MLTPDNHVLDHVDAYVHHALSPPDADEVRRHCSECAACWTALEDARRRKDAILVLPPLEASEELIQRTERRIESHERQAPQQASSGTRSFGKRFSYSAGLAAVILAVIIACVQLYYKP